MWVSAGDCSRSFLANMMEGEQTPVQIGQFVLAKNLGIGAFGKVRTDSVLVDTRKSFGSEVSLC